MKTIKYPQLLALFAMLCGCTPANPPPERLEQKMEHYSFGTSDRDDSTMKILLDSESSMGWKVTAATYDPKTGSVIVFFKKQ